MEEIEVRIPTGPVFAKVDAVDYDDLAKFRWSMAGGKGSRGKYAATKRTVNGKKTTIYMHRMVAARMGLLINPAGEQAGHWTVSVDHKNGDKLDNQRVNLRLRDRPSQMRNGNDALRTTNRSGYRGVSFVARRERFGKPWMAYVTVDYRTKNLGWYATVEEAAS